MTQTLKHRGPDDIGFYQDEQFSVGVSRLAIIDVQGGRQPISNETKSTTAVLNGEIYNYRELRSRLEAQGHSFRSRSDTEVVVHLYEEYGDRCVDLLQGMFALAIWDHPKRRLVLARDRMGIKPLYYAETRGTFVFASEAKALFCHPDMRVCLNEPALGLYLDFKYVPGPTTLFQGVKKLPAGHLLVWEQGLVSVRRYWELVLGDFQPAVNLDEAVEEFEALLSQTVSSHLVSDVPVGVLLSGGLDSSAVTAMMSRHSGRPVTSFTVGFDLPGGHNELIEARRVARHIGTDHHELVVRPDAADLLPKLAWHMDEPVADPAALPTYLICKFARELVPVVLTGEGGDELLAGYPRYVWFARAKALQRIIPDSVRQGALAIGRFAPIGTRYQRGLDNLLASRDDVTRHLHWVSGLSPDLRPLLAPSLSHPTQHSLITHLAEREGDVIHRLMALDMHTWLVDEVLHKMDRMSMAASVEARVPLLDHRLVEFVASLPLKVKLANLGTKTLLKRAMGRHLPRATVRRRKQAFQIPLDQWIAGPLHDFVHDMLLDKRARERGWIDTGRLEMMLGRNCKRPTIDGQSVWTLLSLELWARAFLDH